MLSSPRALTLLLAVTLTLSIMGCSTQDKHVFVSTVHQPTTLTLVDANQNQSVWELDIPVNHKLVVNFENNVSGNTDDQGVAPNWVDWQLYRCDDQPTDTGRNRKGILIQSDRVDLTGMRVRMQISYRPSPELPGSMSAAPVPVVDTAESVAAEAAAEAKVQSQAPAEATTEQAVEAAAEEVTQEADKTVDQAVQEVEEAEKATDEAIEKTDEVPAIDATK